jgi:hypothetical protein
MKIETKRERRRVMENDRKDRSTYSGLSDLSEPPRGGRYKIPSSVDDGPSGLKIGIPWNNLWANDPPEPPLGWSVEEQEPTGEQHEIAASKPKEPTGSPGQVITPGGSSDGSTPAEVRPVVSSDEDRHFTGAEILEMLKKAREHG